MQRKLWNLSMENHMDRRSCFNQRNKAARDIWKLWEDSLSKSDA
ncbi:BnaAnng41040D [Brassica napus]|uniref:BnaAnng41040D protein n=1 Tax=Brassica napus TaxID=3708 RepID=A0A078K0E7_BRANA|nr:BnaAnng41040D [Brassica napus]